MCGLKVISMCQMGLGLCMPFMCSYMLLLVASTTLVSKDATPQMPPSVFQNKRLSSADS